MISFVFWLSALNSDVQEIKQKISVVEKDSQNIWGRINNMQIEITTLQVNQKFIADKQNELYSDIKNIHLNRYKK